MKKVILLALSVLISTTLLAQEKINSDNLPAFKKISVGGKMNVKLVKSNVNTVEITLNGVESSKLNWGMKGEVLNLRLKPLSITDGTVDVTVNYTTLEDIDVSGGNLVCDDKIDFSILKVNVSGGGRLVLNNVKATELVVNCNTNSYAYIKGEAKHMELGSKTASKADLKEMKCESINATINTKGEAYVWATQRLEASSKTYGSLFYKGEPEILRIDKSTFGTANAIGK